MEFSVWERVLILETSGHVGQVALASGTEIVGVGQLNRERRRASDLTQTCQQVLQQAGWKAKQLSAVIVSMGPGSYTALRVGVASAKILAYASGCRFIGVDTFAAFAIETDGTDITVIGDALQGELYHRRYQREDEKLMPMTALDIVTAEACRHRLNTTSIVTGPGTHLLGETNANIVVNERIAPISLLKVAQTCDWAITTDMWNAEPYYLRGSSAEEKLKRMHSAS